jgi:hypothetical protein
MIQEVKKIASHMCIAYICIRVLLRLEFQVARPILNVTLATNQKRPLSQIHIS